MNNEVVSLWQQLPAHVINPESKAMQAMAGGMAGGGFGNRLSLRNSKFRFVVEGKDLAVIPESTLDVIIFALSDTVQRLYFEGEFVQGAKPMCYSTDGKVPSPDSQQVQAATCATCPQNIRGSGRQGNTKACAYKKRVIIVSPYDINGDAYSLDVNGMSMFSDSIPTTNLYSFKGYFDKLKEHGCDVAAIVTRLTFDDDASVPKLYFSPVRFLTPDEYAMVQGRAEEPDVELMLRDLTNQMEDEVPTPVPEPVPPPPPPAPPIRTRTPRTAVPASPPPAPQGVGGLQRGGFPQSAARVINPMPAPARAPKAGSVQVDLSDLVDFTRGQEK